MMTRLLAELLGDGEQALQEQQSEVAGTASRSAAAARPQEPIAVVGIGCRFPGELQQDALLRVHRQRLARRDAEELGVELVGVMDESAFARVGGALVLRIGVIEVVEVPAAVAGEATDGVTAAGDQVPQLVRGGDAARVAAGHADDRDGPPVQLLRFPELAPGRAQLGRDPLEVLEKLCFLGHVGIHPIRRLGERGQSPFELAPDDREQLVDVGRVDVGRRGVVPFGVPIGVSVGVAIGEAVGDPAQAQHELAEYVTVRR